MIGWIKDNFGLKNFFILILVVLVIARLIEGPSWYKFVVGSRYDGIARATVTNVVAKESSFQHINGTNTKTVGYYITYFYEVKNQGYSGTEFLEPDSAIKLVFEQFKSGKTCMIEIKYSLESPSKSSISKLDKSR